MKQIISDFKDEFEQSLNSAANTVKAEPKKFFNSAKNSVLGKSMDSPSVAPKADIGKLIEKAAVNSSGKKQDPILGDKPAASKKVYDDISVKAAELSKIRAEKLRKRFEEIRDEAMKKGEQKNGEEAKADDGQGPAVAKDAKLNDDAVARTMKNSLETGESKGGGYG